MNPLTKILSFADEVEDMRERGYDVTDEREVNETWRHLMSGDVKTVVGYYWLNDEDVGLRQFACMSNGSKYSLKSLERHWIQVVNAQPVTELGEKQ